MYGQPTKSLLPLLIAVAVGTCAPQGSRTIDGTATYRERIALPPGARFEATLEDVSIADAPAEVLASVTIDSAGAPPFEFQIPYNADDIEEGRRYAVRASVTHDGRLLFTTDQVHPVLNGNDEPLDLMMISAGRSKLPGSASGVGERTGMFVYMADAALIALCSDGERIPVAMEGDFAALESAYLGARTEAGQPILVSVEGDVVERPSMEESQPPRPTLVVDRFIGVYPRETCGTPMADSPLRGTYWKLVRLNNEPTTVVDNEREPHLIFDSEDSTVRGSSGCNSVAGSFTAEGDDLNLSLVGTLKACMEGMDQERSFLDAMSKVERYEIAGSHLEVFGASDAPLARFEAVALD